MLDGVFEDLSFMISSHFSSRSYLKRRPMRFLVLWYIRNKLNMAIVHESSLKGSFSLLSRPCKVQEYIILPRCVLCAYLRLLFTLPSSSGYQLCLLVELGTNSVPPLQGHLPEIQIFGSFMKIATVLRCVVHHKVRSHIFDYLLHPYYSREHNAL